MSLNTVTVTWSAEDLSAAALGGSVSFVPSVFLTDPADGLIIGQIQKTYYFLPGATGSATVIANDNVNITQSGWWYIITVSLAENQTYTFNTFINFANGATQKLAGLVPVQPVANYSQYLPLPSGTPAPGQVPAATGAGETSVWTTPVNAPVSSVFGRTGAVTAQTGDYTAAQVGAVSGVTAGDTSIVVGGTAGAPTIATGTLDVIAADHPPAVSWSNNSKKITSLANGSAASDAAAFGQIPVIDSTTGDIQAAPATAAAGATGKTADAGHVHPQPPMFAPTGLTGATAASRYVGATASGAPASGTFALGDYVIDQSGKVWVCTTAGTSGTWTSLGTVTGVTAADTSVVVGGTAQAPTVRTGTLDVIATQHPAAADWSNNSHKITSLANGSGAQDAAAFGQIPVVEGTIGNIKPVGTAAALGSSGKWPDSDHIHLGFFGGIFGNASDGSVTFDGSTTILGMVPSGSAYTMTRDIQCGNITINNGVTLKTANYRILCQGTLTNNGTINNAGANASGQGGAAFPQGSASFPAGRSGGSGGTGVSGTGANGGAGQIGTAGGNGGAGTSGAAGSGGTVTVTSANASANMLSLPFAALSGVGAFAFQTIDIQFGAGGGGGGSDASSNSGGGGGSSGGVIAIFAWAVNNGGGTITAAGGSGFSVAAGNAGGGGGGSGGAILVYTLSAWTAGTTNVAGGALGSGHGTGSNGQAGGNGLVLNTVLA